MAIINKSTNKCQGKCEDKKKLILQQENCSYPNWNISTHPPPNKKTEKKIGRQIDVVYVALLL